MRAVEAQEHASPALAFVYVSGDGTDPTGKSRQMWARVTGRTENDLQVLPMAAAKGWLPLSATHDSAGRCAMPLPPAILGRWRPSGGRRRV
ncbi:hypothetical protein [Streptomyces sp. WP-1]|uniref:hypothetical protein n=1 Tax=Streptomyces sp. WP-1 TaxID=3041497 RepID=UPI002648D2BE|nr:hypothetical protein [Streptomyces sp. WP-1]WKE73512.1 hypothetical protein QHG49_33195 [Streptomyces sp. WP-1]